MKISEGIEEDGVVVGNAYDKYSAKNPIARWLMKGFSDALSGLVQRVGPRTINEIGCGEGYWVIEWNRQGIDARGSDFSKKVIELAKLNAQSEGLPRSRFSVQSIYDLDAARETADLIVCCEVLEHLDDPRAGLSALQRVTTDHLIVSVPREPIWRVLNMARGKYLGDLGNTPGHIQHWSADRFVKLISEYFEVIEVRKPLPWTMLLCRARQDHVVA